MSETNAKDGLPPSQNGGSEAGKEIEEPVKDSVLKTVQTVTSDASVSEVINESDDKLDEFSRLEMEMAELDKTDDGISTKNSSPCAIGTLDEAKEKIIGNVNKTAENENNGLIKQDKTNDAAPAARQNGQASETSIGTTSTNEGIEEKLLDHEDLIAVLKGDTLENQQPFEKDINNSLELPKEESNSETVSDLLIEGVTIEGEGEYQIMEVVDDIEDEAETILPSTSKGLHANKKTSSQKLTPEQARAMAMEQIAGLNARVPRRRKQDIKPLQMETSELVSTLGADWSDDEDDTPVDNERPTSSKNAAAVKHTKVSKKEIPSKAQPATQEVTSTAGVLPDANKKRRTSTGAKITSVVVVKAAESSVNEVANSNSSNAEDSVEAPAPETTGATGFKRTRTIKRRIIWDPDAPETTFSYAKLVRSSSSAKERADTPSSIATSKSRSVTPKEICLPSEKRGAKRAATPLQPPSKTPTNEAGVKVDSFEMPSTSKQALRSHTISPEASGHTGSALVGKKKKISEIDRLMGDEGAANMLSSLESERSKPGENFDDKPHKPLMRNRAGASEKIIKKDVSPASAAPVSTPKNKRVVKPRASSSWDYVYKKKQQLSEDSMIIRRRSNSSYSSNASQHRLSLDGPSGIISKTNAKSSEALSEEDIDKDATGTSRKSPTKGVQKKINNTADEETSPAGAMGNKMFIFAKPKSNQKTPNRRSKGNTGSANTLANDIKKSMPKRGPGRPSTTERLANAEHTTAQGNASASSVTASASNGEEVTVRKLGKTAHILFNMNASQMSCTFTPQLMNKIVSTLNTLAEDVTCHVVVVTTNSPNFCQGLDIANLATGSADQRKSAAIVLATATKNFLRTLATFPKPLVAGIHGTIIGLGVIQLPLFDVVVASDKTSFETPYAKLGQIPEGFCIWQSLPNIHEKVKTKLLWLAEKMYSTEASTTGLIDKLTTMERVNDDAMNVAKKMAAMSTETLRYMKNLTVQTRLEAINLSLDGEFDAITTQWTSVECFTKFKKCMEVGHF